MKEDFDAFSVFKQFLFGGRAQHTCAKAGRCPSKECPCKDYPNSGENYSPNKCKVCGLTKPSKEAPKEAPKKAPKEAPKVEPKEAPKVAPKESPKVAPKEAPKEYKPCAQKKVKKTSPCSGKKNEPQKCPFKANLNPKIYQKPCNKSPNGSRTYPRPQPISPCCKQNKQDRQANYDRYGKYPCITRSDVKRPRKASYMYNPLGSETRETSKLNSSRNQYSSTLRKVPYGPRDAYTKDGTKARDKTSPYDSHSPNVPRMSKYLSKKLSSYSEISPETSHRVSDSSSKLSESDKYRARLYSSPQSHYVSTRVLESKPQDNSTKKHEEEEGEDLLYYSPISSSIYKPVEVVKSQETINPSKIEEKQDKTLAKRHPLVDEYKSKKHVSMSFTNSRSWSLESDTTNNLALQNTNYIKFGGLRTKPLAPNDSFLSSKNGAGSYSNTSSMFDSKQFQGQEQDKRSVLSPPHQIFTDHHVIGRRAMYSMEGRYRLSAREIEKYLPERRVDAQSPRPPFLKLEKFEHERNNVRPIKETRFGALRHAHAPPLAPARATLIGRRTEVLRPQSPSQYETKIVTPSIPRLNQISAYQSPIVSPFSVHKFIRSRTGEVTIKKGTSNKWSSSDSLGSASSSETLSTYAIKDQISSEVFAENDLELNAKPPKKDLATTSSASEHESYNLDVDGLSETPATEATSSWKGSSSDENTVVVWTPTKVGKELENTSANTTTLSSSEALSAESSSDEEDSIEPDSIFVRNRFQISVFESRKKSKYQSGLKWSNKNSRIKDFQLSEQNSKNKSSNKRNERHPRIEKHNGEKHNKAKVEVSAANIGLKGEINNEEYAIANTIPVEIATINESAISEHGLFKNDGVNTENKVSVVLIPKARNEADKASQTTPDAMVKDEATRNWATRNLPRVSKQEDSRLVDVHHVDPRIPDIFKCDRSSRTEYDIDNKHRESKFNESSEPIAIGQEMRTIASTSDTRNIKMSQNKHNWLAPLPSASNISDKALNNSKTASLIFGQELSQFSSLVNEDGCKPIISRIVYSADTKVGKNMHNIQPPTSSFEKLYELIVNGNNPKAPPNAKPCGTGKASDNNRTLAPRANTSSELAVSGSRPKADVRDDSSELIVTGKIKNCKLNSSRTNLKNSVLASVVDVNNKQRASQNQRPLIEFFIMEDDEGSGTSEIKSPRESKISESYNKCNLGEIDINIPCEIIAIGKEVNVSPAISKMDFSRDIAVTESDVEVQIKPSGSLGMFDLVSTRKDGNFGAKVKEQKTRNEVGNEDMHKMYSPKVVSSKRKVMAESEQKDVVGYYYTPDTKPIYESGVSKVDENNQLDNQSQTYSPKVSSKKSALTESEQNGVLGYYYAPDTKTIYESRVSKFDENNQLDNRCRIRPHISAQKSEHDVETNHLMHETQHNSSCDEEMHYSAIDGTPDNDNKANNVSAEKQYVDHPAHIQNKTYLKSTKEKSMYKQEKSMTSRGVDCHLPEDPLANKTHSRDDSNIKVSPLPSADKHEENSVMANNDSDQFNNRYAVYSKIKHTTTSGKISKVESESENDFPNQLEDSNPRGSLLPDSKPGSKSHIKHGDSTKDKPISKPVSAHKACSPNSSYANAKSNTKHGNPTKEKSTSNIIYDLRYDHPHRSILSKYYRQSKPKSKYNNQKTKDSTLKSDKKKQTSTYDLRSKKTTHFKYDSIEQDLEKGESDATCSDREENPSENETKVKKVGESKESERKYKGSKHSRENNGSKPKHGKKYETREKKYSDKSISRTDTSCSNREENLSENETKVKKVGGSKESERKDKSAKHSKENKNSKPKHVKKDETKGKKNSDKSNCSTEESGDGSESSSESSEDESRQSRRVSFSGNCREGKCPCVHQPCQKAVGPPPWQYMAPAQLCYRMNGPCPYSHPSPCSGNPNRTHCMMHPFVSCQR